MIVVEVDVWRRGDHTAPRQAALVVIVNDETGSHLFANYTYAVVLKPTAHEPGYAGLVAQGLRPAHHRGRVEGVPRDRRLGHLDVIGYVIADFEEHYQP